MILSVISGTYNRLPYLQAMVASVRKSIPPNFRPQEDYEIVLADGGSTDGTIEWCEAQGDINLIKQGELLGAIKAFNAAGAAARGDYLVVLNDDIEVLSYTIAKSLAFMLDNPEVGAGCYYQDRGGRESHVETMPIVNADGSTGAGPYLQCGIIPKWLWDKCGGWGDWGGRTYGGDNYLSGKVYESGYIVMALEGCAITDKTVRDDLRTLNNLNCKDGEILWSMFPRGFKIPKGPIYKNPLPERKRVLYAPIIEAGHDVQKQQKRGLRDALGALGLVWEVDYVYGKERVDSAAYAWRPHYIVTQFHTKDSATTEDIAALRENCQGYMVNWNGDVWPNQADPEMMERLRHYDVHLTVNASLLPRYDACGIRAGYWQNAFEPQIADSDASYGHRDVLFVGNCYSDYRLQLAKALKDLPFHVDIYGRGYQPEGLSHGESLYNYRKTGDLYRGAKIGVADNQYLEAKGFFSDRAFMILAAGNCLMLHQVVEGMEELGGLKDGVHYVSWKNIDDLKAKIAYYLEHEDERSKIANAGTAECRKNHSFAARVAQLETLLAQLPKRGTTVSALVICKNEQDNIERCLDQLSWADEIILVDTGSTDGTVPLVWSEGNSNHDRWPQLRVFDFPWVDDFSAARNYAKSKATGDWIFWADADDILPAASIERFKKFSTWSFRSIGIQNPGAFKLWIESRNVLDPLGDQGCYQTRFFKNIPLIQWRKRVHETVDESLRELGVTVVAMNEPHIEHPMAIGEIMQWKQSRNIRLLKMEDPSPWRTYQLGSSYAAMQRWGDAAIYFEVAEREAHDQEFRDFLAFAAGYAFYNMGFTDLALAKFKQTAYPDALYLRAEIEKAPQLYSEFLNTPVPALFPTYSRAWRPIARQALREWHRKELDNLLLAV